jgi:AcrR family transcriptional regulator
MSSGTTAVRPRSESSVTQRFDRADVWALWRLDEPLTWEVVAVADDPRSRRRAETRRRIYDVAMRLFLERGFDGVNVGQIASAAGVSVPTFYAHFPSREHIVLPLPDRADVAAALAAQPVGASAFEMVRNAMLGWIGAFQGREREELLERWSVVIASPGLRLRAAEHERASALIVLESLPPALVAPQQRLATELVITALFSTYTQILLRWAEAGGARSLEDVATEVLTTLRDLSRPGGEARGGPPPGSPAAGDQPSGVRYPATRHPGSAAPRP